jgi:hypothetical protein
MPYVDSIEQALLDHFFNDPAYTPETAGSLDLALSTTTPTDSGSNFTEPSGNGYARVDIPIASMGAAAGTAPAEKSNSAALTFPTASGSWGTVTHYGVMNSGGTVLAWAALDTAKAIGNGDTASFAIGALDFRLGKGTPG